MGVYWQYLVVRPEDGLDAAVVLAANHVLLAHLEFFSTGIKLCNF